MRELRVGCCLLGGGGSGDGVVATRPAAAGIGLAVVGSVHSPNDAIDRR